MKIKQHILFLVGTAWMIDALDVALLSFIMPLLKKEWHLQATDERNSVFPLNGE